MGTRTVKKPAPLPGRETNVSTYIVRTCDEPHCSAEVRPRSKTAAEWMLKKENDESWCPDHLPDWVGPWRIKRKLAQVREDARWHKCPVCEKYTSGEGLIDEVTDEAIWKWRCTVCGEKGILEYAKKGKQGGPGGLPVRRERPTRTTPVGVSKRAPRLPPS